MRQAGLKPKSHSSGTYWVRANANNGTNSKNYGKIQQVVPFKHGRIQIGNFFKAYHGVSLYIGPRFTLNYGLKINILDHFLTLGMSKYNQFVAAGYLNHMFVAL